MRKKTWVLCLILASGIFLTYFSYEVGAQEYLVGIFGIPKGNWSILRDAGLNAAVIRENEIKESRFPEIKKIYVLGINPPQIKKGLKEAKIKDRMQKFRQLNDAYGYYIAGDVSCRRKDLINHWRKLLQIKENAMVGVLNKGKDVHCYPEYDVFFYHYPLMRTKLSLSEALRNHVQVVKSARKRAFIFTQAHPQFWYKQIIKLSGASPNALLYPDGQVVRMLVYHSMASGAAGYFLYNSASLSGPYSTERLLGAAQAILETRPLFNYMAKAKDVSYFQKSDNIYGTIISTESLDIFFVFLEDETAHYHPGTGSKRVKLTDMVDLKKYKSLYQYSPLGSAIINNEVDVPQDHALILIGVKGTTAFSPSDLKIDNLPLYEEVLRNRANALAANLQKFGVTVPPDKGDKDIISLLSYINGLNNLKKAEWGQRAKNMPTDGDFFNRLYWKGKLKKPVEREPFNFYYK